MLQASTFDIPGEPATFATSAERAWKESLSRHIPPPPEGGLPSGVRATFQLASLLRNGHPFDIDNLCEPLFSVLINRQHWFGGKRPNLKWWVANRAVGSPPGCRVSIEHGAIAWTSAGLPIMDAVYDGPLPKGARDAGFGAWARGQASSLQRRLPAFGVYLGFGDSGVNIGDICTGPVKACIDCLYPVVGGREGAPEDWRIAALAVEKGGAGLVAGSVAVRVWNEEVPAA